MSKERIKKESDLFKEFFSTFKEGDTITKDDIDGFSKLEERIERLGELFKEEKKQEEKGKEDDKSGDKRKAKRKLIDWSK